MKEIWQMNLYEHIFPWVVKGEKTVEGRAGGSSKHNYDKLSPGDEIIFTCLGTGEKMRVRVKRVTHYKTVKEYLEIEGLKHCLPWAKSLAEGIGIYYGLADDYEERIRQYGIFAIRIERVK